MNIAFITGINGMDGSYLSEYLLELDYKVYGIVRQSSTPNTSRIDHLYKHKNFKTFYGDVTDSNNLSNTLNKIVAENKDYNTLEIYNLAAQSHVAVSFELPQLTANIDAIGTTNILEAIRILKSDKVKFYQACTSELYGKVVERVQKETTPFYPRSPYACAKLYAFWLTKNYREAYNLFACNGILFNHESKRRGEHFVTRKITIGLGKIVAGTQEYITLGNLSAKRDWGHAKDYVRSMHMMLQHDKPDDYVIATGVYYSVRQFVEKTFALKGFDIYWSGEGLDEVGIDRKTGKVLIKVDKQFYRPAEVDELLGDSTKARNVLGWKQTITFDDIVKEMVDNDCK